MWRRPRLPALIGTGLINSWFLVGSVSSLLRTSYGQILLVKLALFAGMLSLAVANRFWLVPSMSELRSLASDDNQVFGEQALGVMILSIVSFLGTMQPAVSR
jgi:putative copper resistance protein D